MSLGFGHWVFLGLCIGLIVLSVLVITARRPIASAIYLVLVLVGIGVLYLILDAPFVAVMQWLVYAGAIMVLFVFVVMLFQLQEIPDHLEAYESKPFLSGKFAFVLLLSGIFLGFLVKFWILDNAYFQYAGVGMMPQGEGPYLRDVAMLIFSKHVVTFEVLSVVLLAALVGAILLARRNSTHVTKHESS